MDIKEIREIAQSLVNGNIEVIDGEWYRAVKIPDGEMNAPCYLCEVRCKRQFDVIRVCKEMDIFSNIPRYLQVIEDEE